MISAVAGIEQWNNRPRVVADIVSCGIGSAGGVASGGESPVREFGVAHGDRLAGKFGLVPLMDARAQAC